MKILIKTKYIYKNSINNICLTLKCNNFNVSRDGILIDNMRLDVDNITGVYLLHNGYENKIFECAGCLRVTDITDDGQYYKTFSRDKYDKIMENLKQYNAPSDADKIYCEIYNDKKQVTSTENSAKRVTLQLLENLYNKYIVKSAYIKQLIKNDMENNN